MKPPPFAIVHGTRAAESRASVLQAKAAAGSCKAGPYGRRGRPHSPSQAGGRGHRGTGRGMDCAPHRRRRKRDAAHCTRAVAAPAACPQRPRPHMRGAACMAGESGGLVPDSRVGDGARQRSGAALRIYGGGGFTSGGQRRCLVAPRSGLEKLRVVCVYACAAGCAQPKRQAHWVSEATSAGGGPPAGAAKLQWHPTRRP